MSVAFVASEEPRGRLLLVRDRLKVVGDEFALTKSVVFAKELLQGGTFHGGKRVTVGYGFAFRLAAAQVCAHPQA